LATARLSARVLAALLLEQLEEVVHHALVKVLAAEVRVAVGGDDLENTLLDRQQRHVKRAAAQIVDRCSSRFWPFSSQTVRDGGRRRLVDDAHHVEARDRAGVLGRLALRVVEVGRARHHGVLDLLAEVRLGRLLHLGQHHRRDLLGREELLLALDCSSIIGLSPSRQCCTAAASCRAAPPCVVLAANQTLHVKHSVLRVQRALVLRRVANQTLAVAVNATTTA
jgi:hypothetical protein